MQGVLGVPIFRGTPYTHHIHQLPLRISTSVVAFSTAVWLYDLPRLALSCMGCDSQQPLLATSACIVVPLNQNSTFQWSMPPL